MPRLLYLYLAKRIGTGALIVQFALSAPVVLSYLLYMLPPAAVRGGLVWPALLGTTPTITYVTLPMAIGVAAALEFARMASEGMIAVLFALRLSVWSVCRPALALSLVFVVLGYYLASFVAPPYAGTMQDVINVVRNSLNHRMLDAARFYTFDNGTKTLYLERWETADIAVNLYMRQISVEKAQEQTITAARAEFRRNEAGVIVALSKGSVQTRSLLGDEDVRIANFDEYAMALPMQGSSSLPQRVWRGVYELTAFEFLGNFSAARADPHLFGEWMAEAAKRFGVPLLAIGHTLLSMALVLTFGNITGRRGAAGSLVVFAAPVAHIGFLVGLESLLRLDARFALLFVAMLVVEIVVPIRMISRLNMSEGSRGVSPGRPSPRAGDRGYAAPYV
jgi:lipopolysaccharide export system permease protein